MYWSKAAEKDSGVKGLAIRNRAPDSIAFSRISVVASVVIKPKVVL
jgi:hypothetical protein